MLSALFIWLYIGETRGRTLEGIIAMFTFGELETNNSVIILPEINEMFAKRIPARKWGTYHCNVAEYSHRDSTLPGGDDDLLAKKVNGTAEEKFEQV